jgi:hypothetical protein
MQTASGQVVSAEAIARATRPAESRGRIEHAVAGDADQRASVLQRMAAGRRGCDTCGQKSGPMEVRRRSGGGFHVTCEWCSTRSTPRRAVQPVRHDADMARRRRRLEEAEREFHATRR